MASASAYYNENDPKAAAWLRELIKAGLIADGEVDERSIVDVEPGDVARFTQCHWFAGIGGWSLALRLAGWDDGRPCWTGSCPCQSYSEAGFQAGMEDDRDLWPAWYPLIAELRPPVVFGEQVEAAIAFGWVDRLCDDMERIDYAIGAVPSPAASVGAPGIRQRLWFVADAPGARSRTPSAQGGAFHEARWRAKFGREGIRVVSPDAMCDCGHRGGEHQLGTDECLACFCVEFLADADCALSEYQRLQRSWRLVQPPSDPLAGVWSGSDWLLCDDGKARPVEPGTFPLAHGLPNRVVKLRGYGNAINPYHAAEVIAAYMEIVD